MAITSIDQASPIISRQERKIATPLDRVWKVHVAVCQWPDWQHDISSAEIVGPMIVGASFHWRSVGMGEPITSTVYAIEGQKRTLWGGLAAGITGIHEWRFTPIDN